MENRNDTKREAIIAKIKKLFALAENNPSEKEALAAALKAQKLIADNDVTKDELHVDEEADQTVSDIATESQRYAKWTLSFAAVIAENFRCKSYRCGRHYNGVVYYSHHFMGYETDAIAARTTFEALRTIGEQLASQKASECRRLYGTARGVKNSFLTGFMNGVRSELEKQSQELMLVCPTPVKMEYDEFCKQNKVKKEKSRLTMGPIDASQSGFSAGRDAVRSGRMEGQLALA